MRIARIFLLISPLMLFLPPLVPLDKNMAWSMIGMFYGTLLRTFPWNLAMAFLCYTYAKHLGREAGMWAGFSFVFPFIVPVALAFMPPRFNSLADRRQREKPVALQGVVGTFKERFPLLESRLAAKSEPVRALLAARFTPVAANYEFWLTVNPEALARMNAEALGRKFTLWSDPGESGTYLYGAGLVQKDGLEQTAAWLKEGSVSGEKISANWRDKDGTLKLLEYYSV